MKKKSTSQSAFFNRRVLLGFTLSFLGVALAIFAGWGGALRSPDGPSRTGVPAGRPDQPARYMPVPGANVQDEAAGLAQLEQYWNDRLTYPTGRFNPAWVRAAAAQHARMPSGVPFGQHLKLDIANPNALSTTSFTALGPQPERMTGCSGCFDYTKTQGRVNTHCHRSNYNHQWQHRGLYRVGWRRGVENHQLLQRHYHVECDDR